MKFISLVFNIDIAKAFNSGRVWGAEGYKNQQYINDYSAASIATVLHHNPDIQYDVWSDSPSMLLAAIERYDVKTHSLNVMDKALEINKFAQHDYTFWPLVQFLNDNFVGTEPVIKLDTDLTCLKSCVELFKHEGALAWKYERICSEGRERWGETVACRGAFKTTDFKIWNLGVLGFDAQTQKSLQGELPLLTEMLLAVDISSVVRFAEDPNIRVKTWSMSEQTANNYLISQLKLNVKETYPWFDHHCYTHSKQPVIEAAKFLLKTSN